MSFRIIGAGLAGSEAALCLAQHGQTVEIFEQKPKFFSAAHRLAGAAELVCSNSFKSLALNSAHGLLKAELATLGSESLRLAVASSVPGGQALSIDRDVFSQSVTDALKAHSKISFFSEKIDELPQDDIPTLIATGPLTSPELMSSIHSAVGDEGLYFYDATSPVVELDSLDQEYFFWASRRDRGEADYLNLPLTKQQYQEFRNDLLEAEKTEAHLEEEKLKFFEGCLPIEVLAERGEDTLAFSCMKPIGLANPRFPNTYAVIQFRKEKAAGDLLNMVGFQTRMKWPEQKRVFQKLPGMKNANFVRLGAMHRNSFVNAPLHLNDKLQLKSNPNIYMAGQITGSEGYTEALATGHYAALSMMNKALLPETTATRSLVRYLTHSDAKDFQPMNFNFGLLPPLSSSRAKMKLKKHIKKQRLADRALQDLHLWLKENSNLILRNSYENSAWSSIFQQTAFEPKELISNTY